MADDDVDRGSVDPGESGTFAARGGRRLKALVAALPDLLFVLSRDYVFEEYHAPDPDKLLLSDGSFVGETVDAVLPPEIAQTVRASVEQTLLTGRPQTLQYSLVLPAGRRWFEANSAVMDDIRVVFVVRDRTEQVLTEERLRMADRMASIGALASGVAHEVNNALTYVLASINILQQELADDDRPELHAALDDAVHGLDRVHRLVNDLRVFSHPGDTTITPVDLRRVIEATLRLATTELSRRATVSYEPVPIPKVHGNESQIGQVLLNLLSNAADAIPPGSPKDHEIRIAAVEENGGVALRVSDSGRGLPMSLGARIFDPFVTTKDIGEGTGLGLSLSRSIVENLGGSIQAEAREPRGTTFVVKFLRAAAIAPPR